MQVNASLVFIFLAALDARAAWIEKESRSETSSVYALTHRYLVLEDSETGERASIELALFATKSFTLRVIDQPVEPRVDLAVAMQRAKCLAGVNGGYFDPDYKPIGLLIVDGKTVAPPDQRWSQTEREAPLAAARQRQRSLDRRQCGSVV